MPKENLICGHNSEHFELSEQFNTFWRINNIIAMDWAYTVAYGVNGKS